MCIRDSNAEYMGIFFNQAIEQKMMSFLSVERIENNTERVSMVARRLQDGPYKYTETDSTLPSDSSSTESTLIMSFLIIAAVVFAILAGINIYKRFIARQRIQNHEARISQIRTVAKQAIYHKSTPQPSSLKNFKGRNGKEYVSPKSIEVSAQPRPSPKGVRSEEDFIVNKKEALDDELIGQDMMDDGSRESYSTCFHARTGKE
eukprot:TRINITY_DN13289_c0_g1_i1.p1 TRINITY_DN13289_c0_g1~~TRINITY_DN13289_c0_g1_i1.p1  ORF type:complete len:215 (+),score=20.54 TRINITY_DN13289_c0_g1_i1:34-645(+)